MVFRRGGSFHRHERRFRWSQQYIRGAGTRRLGLRSRPRQKATPPCPLLANVPEPDKSLDVRLEGNDRVDLEVHGRNGRHEPRGLKATAVTGDCSGMDVKVGEAVLHLRQTHRSAFDQVELLQDKNFLDAQGEEQLAPRYGRQKLVEASLQAMRVEGHAVTPGQSLPESALSKALEILS